MAEFTGRFRGLGIAQSASPFEGLVLSILGQQISNEVARVLRDLLVDRLGRSGLHQRGRLQDVPISRRDSGGRDRQAERDETQRQKSRVHKRHCQECCCRRPWTWTR